MTMFNYPEIVNSPMNMMNSNGLHLTDFFRKLYNLSRSNKSMYDEYGCLVAEGSFIFPSFEGSCSDEEFARRLQNNFNVGMSIRSCIKSATNRMILENYFQQLAIRKPQFPNMMNSTIVSIKVKKFLVFHNESIFKDLNVVVKFDNLNSGAYHAHHMSSKVDASSLSQLELGAKHMSRKYNQDESRLGKYFGEVTLSHATEKVDHSKADEDTMLDFFYEQRVSVEEIDLSSKSMGAIKNIVLKYRQSMFVYEFPTYLLKTKDNWYFFVACRFTNMFNQTFKAYSLNEVYRILKASIETRRIKY